MSVKKQNNDLYEEGPLYHGYNSDRHLDQPLRRGWLTSEPKEALQYASEHQQRVLPFHVRLENPLHMTPQEAGMSLITGQLQREAQKMGYDGLVIHRPATGEMPMEESQEWGEHRHVIPFDYNKVKPWVQSSFITANILDPIHATLDVRLWDKAGTSKPVLKPSHAHWIKKNIYATLDQAGYTDVEKWLSLVLTGSLTTYQYSEDSDVDVSLFIDAKKFPEWSRAEMIALMVDQMDGTILPGTPFPMQCFVVGEGIEPHDIYKPGLRSAYSLDTNKWIVPPEHREHNVEQEQNAWYVWALQQADRMERLLRYEPPQAIQLWHNIHKKRQIEQRAGKGDFGFYNLLYKMLAQRGLFPRLEDAGAEYIAKMAADFGDDELNEQMRKAFQPEEKPSIYNPLLVCPACKGSLRVFENEEPWCPACRQKTLPLHLDEPAEGGWDIRDRGPGWKFDQAKLPLVHIHPDIPRRQGKTSDVEGRTNWDTNSVKLVMDNDRPLYEESRRLHDQGWTPEQIRDWAIKKIIGPENANKLQDAQEWNEVPEEERPNDHEYDHLPEGAKEFADSLFGPQKQDYDPTNHMIDPEIVNWDEIWQELENEKEEDREYEAEDQRLQDQGLTFHMPGHKDETNQMLDAWLKHHGVNSKDQRLPDNSSAEHHTRMQVPIEHLPMDEGEYSPETYGQWQQRGYGEPRVRSFGWSTLNDIQKGKANPWQQQRMADALTGQGYTPEQSQHIMRPQFTWNEDQKQHLPIKPYEPPAVSDQAPGTMTFPEEWTAKMAAGAVAKFMYDPMLNHLVIGPIGAREGEQSNHAELMRAHLVKHPETREHSLLVGHIPESGYVTMYGGPKEVWFKSPLNPYDARWKAEEAVRRTVPGARFTNPSEKLRDEWEIGDPSVEGGVPLVGGTGDAHHWDFTATMKVASALAHEVYEMTVEGGGATRNLAGEAPILRYGFAPRKETEERVPLIQFSPRVVEEYIDSHLENLMEPGKFIGTWVKDDIVYLDCTEGHEDKDEAFKRAWDGHQQALYDSVTGEDVPVRGMDYEPTAI